MFDGEVVLMAGKFGVGRWFWKFGLGEIVLPGKLVVKWTC